MDSLAKYFVGIATIVVIGGGLIVFALSGPIGSGLPGQNNSTVQSIGSPRVGELFPYDCAFPASTTQLSCDKVPGGYVILPPTGYGPTPSRLPGMTDSAWALLQKTFGNGVCDPNETWYTDPLDCAATGALVNDPYTGRPNAPATVCQAAGRA